MAEQTPDKQRLSDQIEAEGIERVVYGKGLAEMAKLNRMLVDALRTPPSAGVRRELPSDAYQFIATMAREYGPEAGEAVSEFLNTLQSSEGETFAPLGYVWPDMVNWLQESPLAQRGGTVNLHRLKEDPTMVPVFLGTPSAIAPTSEPGRIPELEATRLNAEYWANGARQLAKEGKGIEEVMQCYMQATNAWRNAAYAAWDKRAGEARKIRDAALEEAAHIALRRTEIPKGARHPTRDQVVIVGEEIAAIIRDKKSATTGHSAKDASNG